MNLDIHVAGNIIRWLLARYSEQTWNLFEYNILEMIIHIINSLIYYVSLFEQANHYFLIYFVICLLKFYYILYSNKCAYTEIISDAAVFQSKCLCVLLRSSIILFKTVIQNQNHFNPRKTNGGYGRVRRMQGQFEP